MSVSLPSKEIFSIDVPRPQGFDATFAYNFFVPDESVAETSADAAKYAMRPADSLDASFQQFITSRVPRFVRIDFGPAHQAAPAKNVSSATIRAQANAQRQGLARDLISTNMSKVLTEDQFAGYSFISIGFHDGEIDDRIYEFVSGSYLQRVLDEPSADASHHRAAMRLDSYTSRDVSPHFLSKGMGMSQRSHGTRFHDKRGQRTHDKYFSTLKDVHTHVQLNGKMLHDVIDRTISDPHAQYASDLVALHKTSKTAQRAIRGRFSPSVSPSDYKNVVPYVSMVPATSFHPQDTNAEVIGYIVDKVEVLPNGQSRQYDPIVVENGRASTTTDLRVRYGATYAYSARSVALFTLPAIDDDSGSLSIVKILVSSKPSQKVYVKCVDNSAPPPPADLNFTWDYQAERLLVHWTFPTNSQRDVKKFQVFRRTSINDPFELVKMYDFDDSFSPSKDREDPDPSLVERLTNPATFWIDDDFTKRSSYIYAVACIDAHGLTSHYSAQFKISFDIFKNRIVKELVSHTGAPKPYPNLYVEADAFVDTIRDSGHSSMTLYFNPDHYSVYDDNGRVTPTIATAQTGGRYKLQFINVDAQKVQSVDVVINDLTTK